MPLELDIPESMDADLRDAFGAGANLGFDHVNYALTYGTDNPDDSPMLHIPAEYRIEGRTREAFRDGWGLGAGQARQAHEDEDVEQPDPPVSYRDKFNVPTERRWDSRAVESRSVNNDAPMVHTRFDLGHAEVMIVQQLLEAALQGGNSSMVGSWLSRLLGTPNATFSITVKTDRYQ